MTFFAGEKVIEHKQDKPQIQCKHHRQKKKGCVHENWVNVASSLTKKSSKPKTDSHA